MTDPEDGPWDGATEHDDAALGEDPPTVRATLAQSVGIRAAGRASSTLPPPGETRRPAQPPAAPPPTAEPPPDEVILLDTVSASTPTGEAPRRGDVASGGIVIVATGGDAERVRKLCHAHGLLVPVMSSIAVVHEALSVVVVGEPSPPAPERVVHVVRPTITDEALLALLRSLVGGRVVGEPLAASGADDPRVLEATRRLATLDDRGAVEMIAIEAITSLTEADRAHCLFHDPNTGALWSESLRKTTGDDRRATAGLVGFAAQTGLAIHASPAGDDPRWLVELDDPEGKAQSRILVQPVVGADRRVHAVMVAARRWRRSAFTDDDRAHLARLAALAAPTIDLAVGAMATPPTEDARKPRSTQPGALARSATTEEARTAAAIVDPRAKRPSDPPRAASDSRPPPVTAPRPAPPSSPPPATSNSAPRSKSDSARTATPVAGTPRTKSDSARTATPVAGTPRTKSDSARTATPVAGTPTTRAASESGLPRSKSDSAPPARDGEQHDLAVVSSDDDTITRVKRIAKRARVELVVVSRAEDVPPYYRIITFGQAWSPDADPRVAYVARTTLTDDQIVDLFGGLATDRSVAPPPTIAAPHGAAEARRAQIAFAGSRQLAAATDLAVAEAVAIATTRELIDADRAYCLFFDAKTGALWSESRKRASGDDRHAIAGIAGWAARTGRATSVPHASADPRWLAPLDDPDGDTHGQLLVQPIVGADRRVRGVVVAVRRAKRPGFGDLDASLLARFAALVAPLLEQLAVHVETQQLLGDARAVRTSTAASSPFASLSRAPRWTFAAAGALITLLVVLAARC